MENGIEPKPSTPEATEHIDTSSSTTSLKDPTIPILMFLGVIAATLSIIVAGYFKGNMHLITTLKNATHG